MRIKQLIAVRTRARHALMRTEIDFAKGHARTCDEQEAKRDGPNLHTYCRNSTVLISLFHPLPSLGQAPCGPAVSWFFRQNYYQAARLWWGQTRPRISVCHACPAEFGVCRTKRG